jgi:hypothetical protein
MSENIEFSFREFDRLVKTRESLLPVTKLLFKVLSSDDPMLTLKEVVDDISQPAPKLYPARPVAYDQPFPVESNKEEIETVIKPWFLENAKKWL